MQLENKKILVTGADGFIGSHLVEYLVEQGCDVRAFVFYNALNSWGWLDHIKPEVRNTIQVVSGDIRDATLVKNTMQGCHVVLHLAALIGIPYSYQAPNSYVETNIKGTLNILEAAKELGIEKVIHTSTSEVYGTARFIPITEEHPLQAQSPYAATKTAADQLALSFFHSFQVPVCIIRPFNTYGPRQSARAVIPTIITQLTKGRKYLDLGSLQPTRDFNFVRDIVSAFFKAIKTEDALGQVINIGTGFEISIGKVAQLIAHLMGTEVEIKNSEDRHRPLSSEVMRLCADASKAKKILGWHPRYTGLDGLKDGLKETISWFRDDSNLNRYKTDLYNV